MKFLDLTKTPAVEVELDLSEIQRIIQTETGRELRFANPDLAKKYNSDFKLIKYPPPLGFAIAAAIDIPQGSLLFPYGGDVKKVRTDAIATSDKTEYLLHTHRPDGFSLEGQAQEYGDLGSLSMHLPDETFLNQMEIDPRDWNKILQENIKSVCLDDDDTIYFIASCDIKANTPLGFNYDIPYWIDLGISPLLIESGNFCNVIDLKSISFEGVAALRDEKRQLTRLFSLESYKNDVYYGLSMARMRQFFDENKHKEKPDHFFIMTLSLHVVIDWSTLSRNMEQTRGVCTNARKVNPKNLITFFDTTPLFTCAPPPGSTVIDNKTSVHPKT